MCRLPRNVASTQSGGLGVLPPRRKALVVEVFREVHCKCFSAAKVSAVYFDLFGDVRGSIIELIILISLWQ
jgi:hypothetical protein